jgi:hypothetical protein
MIIVEANADIAGKPAPTGFYGEHSFQVHPHNLWELACQR